MTQHTPNLLRRTLVLIGVAAGFATATSVVAQGTVTLSGSSGNSCSYSAMTIAPNGNVTVTCQGGGGPPPPPPGQAYFTISGPASLTPSTAYSAGQFKVSRTDTNGPADSVAFGYTVTGNGCQFRSRGPYWLSPPNGSKPSETLDIQSEASGSCTITLTIQEGHTGSSPHQMTVAGSPVPAGCPAVDPNIATERPSSYGPVDHLRMDSGKIAYYKVIAPPNPAASVVVDFTQGQQPATPAGMVTEYSVSLCPGTMDKHPATQCYYRSTNIDFNKIVIYTAGLPQWNWIDQTSIGDRGCYAPALTSAGQSQQFYVNVRWTYPSCPWGSGYCGTALQWGIGSNW